MPNARCRPACSPRFALRAWHPADKTLSHRRLSLLRKLRSFAARKTKGIDRRHKRAIIFLRNGEGNVEGNRDAERSERSTLGFPSCPRENMLVTWTLSELYFNRSEMTHFLV